MKCVFNISRRIDADVTKMAPILPHFYNHLRFLRVEFESISIMVKEFEAIEITEFCSLERRARFLNPKGALLSGLEPVHQAQVTKHRCFLTVLIEGRGKSAINNFVYILGSLLLCVILLPWLAIMQGSPKNLNRGGKPKSNGSPAARPVSTIKQHKQHTNKICTLRKHACSHRLVQPSNYFQQSLVAFGNEKYEEALRLIDLDFKENTQTPKNCTLRGNVLQSMNLDEDAMGMTQCSYGTPSRFLPLIALCYFFTFLLALISAVWYQKALKLDSRCKSTLTYTYIFLHF